MTSTVDDYAAPVAVAVSEEPTADDVYSDSLVDGSARRVSWSDDSVSQEKPLTKRHSKNTRTWDEMFSALCNFKRLNGHSNVPYYEKSDKHLGSWVYNLRKGRANLTPDQEEKLESIGFDWASTQERIWNDKFERLKAYFKKFGNSTVPHHFHDGHGTDLCNWISKQRQINLQGRLPQDRYDKLCSVNFTWKVKTNTPRVSPKEETKWTEKYRRLVAYEKKFGNCAVPFQYELDKSLGRWVNEQRTQNTRGMLRKDRKKLLEKIGFLWRIKNSDTPLGNIQYPKKQQQKRKAGEEEEEGETIPAQTAPKKRPRKRKEPAPMVVSDSEKDNNSIASVDSDGILIMTAPLDYDPHALDFGVMYSRLQTFQQQYGKQVQIPPDYAAGALGPWLAAMKQQARAGQLPDDHARKLMAAGIVLVHGESQLWLEGFGKTRDFITRFGHSQVSDRDDPELAAWVTAQRRRFSQGKLSKDRKKRLQSIGFALDEGFRASVYDAQVEETCATDDFDLVGGFFAAAMSWSG